MDHFQLHSPLELQLLVICKLLNCSAINLVLNVLTHIAERLEFMIEK